MRRPLALLAALTLGIPSVPAAADAPAPAAAPPAAAKPDAEVMVGEVLVLPYNRSAAYGPTRVQGPKVNLTDGGNGEWKGSIRDFDGVFKVSETRISGANFNMVMERDGDEWVCQGTVEGKRVRIAMTADSLVARYDSRLYDMKRVAPDLYASPSSGPGVRVKGDAAGKNPFYPQFIFALLAVL